MIVIQETNQSVDLIGQNSGQCKDDDSNGTFDVAKI